MKHRASACPSCDTDLPPEEIICPECGFDRRAEPPPVADTGTPRARIPKVQFFVMLAAVVIVVSTAGYLRHAQARHREQKERLAREQRERLEQQNREKEKREQEKARRRKEKLFAYQQMQYACGVEVEDPVCSMSELRRETESAQTEVEHYLSTYCPKGDELDAIEAMYADECLGACLDEERDLTSHSLLYAREVRAFIKAFPANPKIAEVKRQLRERFGEDREDYGAFHVFCEIFPNDALFDEVLSDLQAWMEGRPVEGRLDMYHNYFLERPTLCEKPIYATLCMSLLGKVEARYASSLSKANPEFQWRSLDEVLEDCMKPFAERPDAASASFGVVCDLYHARRKRSADAFRAHVRKYGLSHPVRWGVLQAGLSQTRFMYLSPWRTKDFLHVFGAEGSAEAFALDALLLGAFVFEQAVRHAGEDGEVLRSMVLADG